MTVITLCAFSWCSSSATQFI